MGKSLIVLGFIVLVPFFGNAYNTFIWHYDTLDRFYEPDIGDSVTCAYWLEQALYDNGHTYVTGIALPTNLDAYDIIFVTLGWYRC